MSFPNASVIGAVITSLEAAKAKGKEMGYDVVVDDPGTDLNKQINTIKTWVEQKVPVIVVNTLQPAAFESVAKQAREAGIIWITYGQKIENQDATVGYAQYPDGRQLGEYAGEWVTKNQGGKGKAIILGYEKGVWGQQRGAGIKEGLLAKAPGVENRRRTGRDLPDRGPQRHALAAAGASRRQHHPGSRGSGDRGRLQGLDRGREGQGRPGRLHRRHGTARFPALKLLKEGGNVYRASMAIPLVQVGYAIVETGDKLLKGEKTGGRDRSARAGDREVAQGRGISEAAGRVTARFLLHLRAGRGLLPGRHGEPFQRRRITVSRRNCTETKGQGPHTSGAPMPFAVHALRKSYGGVEVLKGVDLEVADGEIHALLGANGAGKSTLIKCLSGAIQPDSGVMIVGRERYEAFTPKSSKQSGIAVIYQDLSLATSLDVADNMFLGQELRSGPFVRRRAQRREAAEWLAQLGVDIRPTAALATLGNAGLQAVEIAKALRTRPKVLILDEPTAALSEKEAEALGEQMLKLKQQNLPLLYVTHRLAEVFALADRVTVLRGGEVVLTGKVRDLSRDDLVAAIAGESIQRERPPQRDGVRKPAVAVRGLVAAGIGPVDFDIREGEVLGVFGLVGSGRTELLEALFGSHRVFGGDVSVDGARIRASSPGDAVAAGIALVPSDRLRKSIIGQLSAGEKHAAAFLPAPRSRRAAQSARRAQGLRHVRAAAQFAAAARRLAGPPLLRRQPAEAGHRALAERHHLLPPAHAGRADARRRCRRAPRHLCGDPRERGCGQERARDLVRAGRTGPDRRSRDRPLRRAHRRDRGLCRN